MKFIFFGTPKEAVLVLNRLKARDFLPALVVTAPDRPAGRGLNMEESPVALWAKEHNIPVYKPESLKNEETITIIKNAEFDLGIVFAYGKIIPQSILDIPKKGTLNIHPSLLPLYRGPAPVEGAILAGENETGVSIMVLDSQMDHGPILAQEKITISNQAPNGSQKDSNSEETVPVILKKLVTIGAEKLAAILPDFLSGKLKAQEQDHDKATYTKKITKSDGEIRLTDDPVELYKKYRAYYGWPGLFFFEQVTDKKTRVIIKKARFENGQFIIERVLPEGKKEINYNDYSRSK